MDIVVQVFKGLSQVLIPFGGTWALISRTHEQDPSTGRRKLTQSGWMKLSILAVGFVLFTLTEFQNRAQQREAIRGRIFQAPFSQTIPFSQLPGIKMRTRLALSEVEGIGLGKWREVESVRN